jgi:hypothetical protein
MPVRVERGNQIVFAQGSGTEMIFERLGRNRALHANTVHFGRERDHEIARAILRTLLREMNVHDHRLVRCAASEAATGAPRFEAVRLRDARLSPAYDFCAARQMQATDPA